MNTGSTEDFTLEDLLRAEAMLQRNPAAVTDAQIGYLATYDRAFAAKAVEKRSKAIAAARSAPSVRSRAPARGKARSAENTEAAADAVLRAWEAAMTTGNADQWNSVVEQYEHTPITLGTLNALAVNLLIEMNAKNRERNTRIAAIEARLNGLEGKQSGSGVEWKGVHRVGNAYSEGGLVTRKGSLWLALRDTTSVPGTSAADWKLVVKNGSLRDEDAR